MSIMYQPIGDWMRTRDEAAWVKWFEEGEDEGEGEGGLNVDSNVKPYGGYIGPPRPEGSQRLEDAYRDVWHARSQEEYRREYAEWALSDLNKCLAEVTRIKQEEACV